MSMFSPLKQPWLQFILMGSVLFYLQASLFPTPKPVIGPLGEARVEQLRQQWRQTMRHEPSDAQLAGMVAAELDREILFQRAAELELYLYDPVVRQRLLRNMSFLQLSGERADQEVFREALQMRLHLDDEVIKRRLIQVMKQLLLSARPPQAVTELAIEAEFERRRGDLRLPARYTLEHLYFTREREQELQQVITEIRNRQLDVAAARQFSSPFLSGYQFSAQSPDQLSRRFGAAFVENFLAAEPEPMSWSGPVRSTYGFHYVWVESIEPSREAGLEEVRDLLLRELQSRARDEALREGMDALRRHYEVRR